MSIVKWTVSWWEEVDDVSTDFSQSVYKESGEEAIEQIKREHPLARKLSAKNW